MGAVPVPRAGKAPATRLSKTQRSAINAASQGTWGAIFSGSTRKAVAIDKISVDEQQIQESTADVLRCACRDAHSCNDEEHCPCSKSCQCNVAPKGGDAGANHLILYLQQVLRDHKRTLKSNHGVFRYCAGACASVR